MANCIRHVVNRVKYLNSTFVKKHPFESRTFPSDLSYFVRWKQDLSSVRQIPQFSNIGPLEEKSEYFEQKCFANSPIDNRELTSDVVTKQYITKLNEYDIHLQAYLLNDEIKQKHLRIVDGQNPILRSSSNKDSTSDSPLNKPSPESLHRIFTILSNTLPKLFIQPMDYSIYHQDLINENNIRGTRTVGVYHFVKEIALLRTVGHLKFAYVKFDILKITQHPEDSSVKVRWRISGISAWTIMWKFWKYKIWDLRNIIQNADTWYDGFSTFYVNADGLVYKHVADKMMPDSERTVRTATHEETAKLMLIILGIIPEVGDVSSIM